VAFSLFSIVWSDYPDLTLRRGALLFLLTVIAMALAIGIKDLRSFHTYLFVGLTAIVAINLLATALAPSLAITDIGVKGLYTQKKRRGNRRDDRGGDRRNLDTGSRPSAFRVFGLVALVSGGVFPVSSRAAKRR